MNFADLDQGTRTDVARLLDGDGGGFGLNDGLRLLEYAWQADRREGRAMDLLAPSSSDREVDDLIKELCVFGNPPLISGATLARLYLAGEVRVAQRTAVALNHPRRTVRELAIHLTLSISDSDCLEAFLATGNLRYQEAQITALRLICRIGELAHLPIIRLALTHPAEVVSLDAIGAVLRLRPPETVALILLAASSRSPAVCVRGLTALGELGDLSVMPQLTEELESASPFHRIGAARGLTALALRCPNGDYSSAMEALQKKARLGGVEYRRALELIRRAIGIDPELPIPAGSVELRTKSLPIPDERGDSALFEPNWTSQQLGKASNESAVEEDDSLSRRLKNMLPRPDTWEYD